MTTRALEAHDLDPFDGAQIDVSDCNRLEICVGLNEHEKAGPRMETWPDAVRVQVERSMRQWLDRNPGRVIKLVSAGVEKRMCVLIIHHAASAGGSTAVTATADSEPPAPEIAGGKGVASPPPVSPPAPADRCIECGG